MSVRVLSTSGKVTAVVLATVVGLPMAVGVSLVAGSTFGMLLAAVVLLTIVIFAARTFRGTNEPIEPPRPWWKLTASAKSGYLVAALFTAQAIYVLGLPLGEESGMVYIFTAAVHFAIAAAYVHSSLRLSSGDSPAGSRSTS